MGISPSWLKFMVELQQANCDESSMPCLPPAANVDQNRPKGISVPIWFPYLSIITLSIVRDTAESLAVHCYLLSIAAQISRGTLHIS